MSSTPSPLFAVIPPPGGEDGTPPASAGSAGDSPTFNPLYQQIKTLILQNLQADEWKLGEMIPSEIELATRYKVSQGAVHKAINELAVENLTARRRGKDTFVTTYYEEGVQFRFLRLMSGQGKQRYPGNCMLEYRRVCAPTETTRLLGLKTGNNIVQTRRTLSLSDGPAMLEEIWLPGVSFKGLTAEELTGWKGPTYIFLEMEFGVCMLRATKRIHAVTTDSTTVELLSMTAESPLLSVERVSYTLGDKPVKIRRSLYVTTWYYYQSELN